MTGLHLTVPAACFRKGLAREFFETEPLPPPSTGYGFLLSLVGEEDRQRHCGVRVAPAILGTPRVSTVLRTLWRHKAKQDGAIQPPANRRPDYQQLLTNLELILWLDSGDELHAGPTLEDRVLEALDPARRHAVRRFGGLSLGESTHLVNDVCLLPRSGGGGAPPTGDWRIFLTAAQGARTLPVWVDHVGSIGTRHETGDLEPHDPAAPPPRERMPQIQPPQQAPPRGGSRTGKQRS